MTQAQIIASCLASEASWRRAARNLRDHATASRLRDEQRAALLREATAADRQADWWRDAAVAARATAE